MAYQEISIPGQLVGLPQDFDGSLDFGRASFSEKYRFAASKHLIQYLNDNSWVAIVTYGIDSSVSHIFANKFHYDMKLKFHRDSGFDKENKLYFRLQGNVRTFPDFQGTAKFGGIIGLLEEYEFPTVNDLRGQKLLSIDKLLTE